VLSWPVETVWATAIEAAKAIAERVAIANVLKRGLFISSSYLHSLFVIRGAFQIRRHRRGGTGYRIFRLWSWAFGLGLILNQERSDWPNTKFKLLPLEFKVLHELKR
jgi:hypothetical protein